MSLIYFFSLVCSTFPLPPLKKRRFSTAPIASFSQGNNQASRLVAGASSIHLILTLPVQSSTATRLRSSHRYPPPKLNLEEYPSGWTD